MQETNENAVSKVVSWKELHFFDAQGRDLGNASELLLNPSDEMMQMVDEGRYGAPHGLSLALPNAAPDSYTVSFVGWKNAQKQAWAKLAEVQREAEAADDQNALQNAKVMFASQSNDHGQ
jgi:hypothetical protein